MHTVRVLCALAKQLTYNFHKARQTRHYCSSALKPKAHSVMTVGIKERVDNIIKSQEDKRSYRGLIFENGMKAVLVSDPDTDKSAAALDVSVGHLSDPEDLPGLAHFCEHMLFLGTEKYPSENEYNKFLSEHSGSCNAFTSPDHTNYYFDVAPEHLLGVLDRFAQFFRTPLFTESATDREVNAVHSEHEKNIPSDTWRLSQLEKATAKPGHAYGKFGTGNKDTLDAIPRSKNLNVRDELLKFHQKWYSADIMGLSVLGRESLDELETYVSDLFRDVLSKNIQKPEWTDHPYGPNELQKKLYVVPVKDLRNLYISFPIPDLTQYYNSHPGHYLGHLIGHEGEGSLLSELKAKGWVNTLVGGQKPGARGFAFFVITVDLTEEGIEHVDDIITNVFQYLNMLKHEGPQEWVYKECEDLGNMQFRFKDKERPQSYVSNLASLLHEYPLDQILSVGYLINEWRPDLINMVLSHLLPEKIRVGVVGKKYEELADSTEKWYGTRYKMDDISASTLKMWNDAGINANLRLPPKNEFIPTDFDLVPREENVSKTPILLQDTPMSRVWFKQDDEFLLPKAVLNFELYSPVAYLDPLHTCMTYMFASLFNDALNEYTYSAELAGLMYSMNNIKYGISLCVRGYSHKQHIFLEKIMKRMTCFTVEPQRYHIIREAYIRNLRNFQAEQPHQQATYYASVLLTDRAWTKDEVLNAAINDLTLEKLQHFIGVLLSQLHIECLIHGNITQKRALELVGLVESQLQLSLCTRPVLPSQLTRDREVQLSDKCHFVYETTNKVHKSSCIQNYYQCCLQSTESNILLELLGQILNEPCFNILRTQEQLGYIVFSGLRRSNCAQGLRVIVQSDRHPEYVDKRIEAFLYKMQESLLELSEAEFQRHKDAHEARRLEKPKTLMGRSNKYWNEIASRQYHFDRDNVEVAFLRTVTKSQLIDFYNDMIAVNGEHRHKLSVHVISEVEKNQDNQNEVDADNQQTLNLVPPISTEPLKITNITEYKSGLGLLPLVKPYSDVDGMAARSKL